MAEQDGSRITTSPNSQNDRPRSRRRWIVLGSIVGAFALLGAAGASVYAHGGGWRHGMSAEAFSEHLDAHVKDMLSDVGATTEQQTQVTSIVQSTIGDVRELKGQHASAHDQLHEILSAATIDRARLEAVRAEQIRLADEASQRLVQGIADAAEVLTPEQRAALVARMEARHRDWHDK